MMQEEVLTSHAILKGMLTIHKIEGARADETIEGTNFNLGPSWTCLFLLVRAPFIQEKTFRF